MFFPTALHTLPILTRAAPRARAGASLSDEARWLLAACPAAPSWLEARWRALLSALLCDPTAEPLAARAKESEEEREDEREEEREAPSSLCALAALCLLVTPQPQRPAALEGLLATCALPPPPSGEELTREDLRAAAASLREELLSALEADAIGADARAALRSSLVF